jgi:hypothetical protein
MPLSSVASMSGCDWRVAWIIRGESAIGVGKLCWRGGSWSGAL